MPSADPAIATLRLAWRLQLPLVQPPRRRLRGRRGAYLVIDAGAQQRLEPCEVARDHVAQSANKLQTCSTLLHDTARAGREYIPAVSSQISDSTTFHATTGEAL